MPSRRLVSPWIIVLSAGLCPILACGWLAFQFWEALPTAALQRARERWAQRTFDHYTWRVIYRAGTDCLQDIEVEAEQVVVSHPHPEVDCDIQPQTVTEFFDLVQRYIERSRCGPNGCACDGPVATMVAYDEQLGYPVSLRRQLRPQLRWLNLDYWNGQFTGGLVCRSLGFGGLRITVSQLTPLP
jgi:hypothetical protein